MKRNKGITLIALVITIVVLIILAGVAISLSLGENGIFNKAKFASEEYANEQELEMAQINNYGNQIDSYINGNREQGKITYSLNEQVVGIWIDGKPLYEKTVSFGALPNSTTKYVDPGIENVDQMVYIYGYAYAPSQGNLYVPLPQSSPNNLGHNYICDYHNYKIRIVTGNDASIFTKSYVTLRYTKTTDEATISIPE